MTAIEFNHQVLSFVNPLSYFAKSLTSDKEEAKDLVQDTLLKALTYKDKFAEKTNLKAWLYTIMKNTFINNYRRKTRSRTIVDETKELYYLNVPQDSGFESPEGSYAHNEITNAINGLEDEYKVPFEMHNKGFKYKEIANQLDLPIGTVKSRIFMARKRLMEELKDYRKN